MAIDHRVKASFKYAVQPQIMRDDVRVLHVGSIAYFADTAHIEALY